jgi:hypothetical protein
LKVVRQEKVGLIRQGPGNSVLNHEAKFYTLVFPTEKPTAMRLGRRNRAICSTPCGTITSQISFRLKQPNINIIIKRINKERFRRGWIGPIL